MKKVIKKISQNEKLKKVRIEGPKLGRKLLLDVEKNLTNPNGNSSLEGKGKDQGREKIRVRDRSTIKSLRKPGKE